MPKGVFECRACDLTFASKEEKERHRWEDKCSQLVKRRRLNGVRTYWCTLNDCNKPFGSREMRLEHQRIVHGAPERKLWRHRKDNEEKRRPGTELSWTGPNHTDKP